jgi:predicted CoA-binding protein
MSWQEPNAVQRLEIIQQSKVVAIVGVSANRTRASYFVASYLTGGNYYKVYFVNPMIDQLFGEKVYPTLADLPEIPDIVDVFRKAEDTPKILDEAIDIGAKTIWLQLGISNDEVAQRGTAAGLKVVMNRCLKIEHARFRGGLHLAGFNTGVISSKRAKA